MLFLERGIGGGIGGGVLMARRDANRVER